MVWRYVVMAFVAFMIFPFASAEVLCSFTDDTTDPSIVLENFVFSTDTPDVADGELVVTGKLRAQNATAFVDAYFLDVDITIDGPDHEYQIDGTEPSFSLVDGQSRDVEFREPFFDAGTWAVRFGWQSEGGLYYSQWCTFEIRDDVPQVYISSNTSAVREGGSVQLTVYSDDPHDEINVRVDDRTVHSCDASPCIANHTFYRAGRFRVQGKLDYGYDDYWSDLSYITVAPALEEPEFKIYTNPSDPVIGRNITFTVLVDHARAIKSITLRKDDDLVSYCEREARCIGTMYVDGSPLSYEIILVDVDGYVYEHARNQPVFARVDTLPVEGAGEQVVVVEDGADVVDSNEELGGGFEDEEQPVSVFTQDSVSVDEVAEESTGGVFLYGLVFGVLLAVFIVLAYFLFKKMR